jgi:hypothetical protein
MGTCSINMWVTYSEDLHTIVSGCFFTQMTLMLVIVLAEAAMVDGNTRLLATHDIMVVSVMSWCLQLKWATKLGIDLQECSSGLSDKREYHTLLRDKFQMKQR